VAAGYLGIFPLILAGLAILLRRGQRTRTLAVVAAGALLFALGGESILHGWAYLLLPGFSQVRAPARMVFVLSFALAALAALGLDRLLSPLERRARAQFRGAWRGLLWLAGGAAILGGAWAYLVVYMAQDKDPVLFWRVSAAASGVILALAFLAASVAWLGARYAGRLPRRALAWLAVGLVFFDLASMGAYTDLGFEPPTTGFDHPQAVGFLQADPGFFRIDSRTDVAQTWQPSLAQLAGFYDVGGVDNPLVVADVARYWEGTGGRSTRLYDFLGARYIIGGKDVTLDWAKFSLAYDGDPTVNVYRNETALPRAFAVHSATAAASHQDAWALVQAPGFDPATNVVLEGGQPMVSAPSASAATVKVKRYASNSLALEVDTPASGYLVLSDPYYPGWRARVDGQATTILRANYAFRAIPVPAGAHQVTMHYRPASFLIGLGITVLTVILLILTAVLLVHRRRAGQRVGVSEEATGG
jgi:hypothetical protein